MNIIGINAWHADASAALISDGKLLLAIEEERFTRSKHWAGFPSQAIAFCIREAGLNFDDIQYFSIGRDPKAKLFRKMLYLAGNPSGSLQAVRERLHNRNKVKSVAQELAVLAGQDSRQFKNRIRYVEHHLSHLASAFYASPFEKAACMSIDGSGDFTTTMAAIAEGNKIQTIHSVDFPHSLGIFYTAFTQLLGFPFYGDEYKVMGMAPYGSPVFKDKISELIHLLPDGRFTLDLSFFRRGTDGIITYDKSFTPVVAPLYSQKMVDLFGAPRNPQDTLTQRHKDIAASVQAVAEETIFAMLNKLYDQTHCDNLCLAGGVAQNSVANGKIKLRTPFKEVYIPSAGHDAGISMGAGLFTYFDVNPSGGRTYVGSAYLGSQFSNEQIKKYLDSKRLSYMELADEEIFSVVADELIKGSVAGWFTGRAEFGPRALGGRSILADPTRTDAKDIINTKIKRRESFRPFAPSILKEYVADFFEQSDETPFMEKVFVIKPEKRALVPAVTHVDGTGRLQTVDSKTSPRYYALIDCFRKKNGIPILLNTSFNENEPIVNTPENAVDCYLRTDMDMLVMENIVLRKR